MAEAVVRFAVERLGELLLSEAKFLYGVSEINEVQRQLKRMQCFLEEADKKQNQDERVQGWVAEMRELAFKTEDVVETFAMKVATAKQKSGFKKMLRRFACILSEGISRHSIAKEIDAIQAELTNLTSSLTTYGITKSLGEGDISHSLGNLKDRRIFYSHDDEKDFVGMNKEIEQLLSHLKNEDKGCEVFSICGMGGQGKTTLAKKLYNHDEVKAHFKAFAWVCITQEFEREKVLKGILKNLLPAEREGEVLSMDDSKLVKELYKVQQEKNCLIVIDDIWTVDSWSSLKPAFPVAQTTTGSKILFTTRDVTVAQIGSIFKLKGLTKEEGWELLSKKAGINNLSDDKVTSELKRIGMKMAKRCNGLPLAISSLGGILKGKLLREWKKINNDISFYLSRGERVINNDEYYTVTWVLGLSYDSLPPRLRHCFLCFANYTEDEVIGTEELYMFWMAEGLISVDDKAEGEMMMDVAERYLDELANRNLVQVETSKLEGVSWSKYGTCHVHDLIRDLCLSKVKEEKVINVFHLRRKSDNDTKASLVRRLCIRSYDDGDESMLKPYDKHVISHIRSLLVWKSHFNTQGVWPDKKLSLGKFKLLRVLTVRRYRLTMQNLRSISELVYLKYLCLRDCVLEELPTSIDNLRNLETLDLRVHNCLTIPNVIWKLKKLKHLYLPYRLEGGRSEKLKFEGLDEWELIYNYDSMYCDAHDLIRLCKLKVFDGKIMVEDNLTEKIIAFFKSQDMCHSNLSIQGEGGVCLVLLLESCFIDVLTITTGICKIPKEYDHTCFSTRLTRLWLEYCEIEQDPMILLEQLPNLCSLSLGENAYMGTEMVCTAMGFPQLRKLGLSSLPGLRKWRVEEGAMPNISYIEIWQCEELEMLPQGFRYLHALEFLYSFNMPPTFTKRIKVIDKVEGEDFYKIRHITNVISY